MKYIKDTRVEDISGKKFNKLTVECFDHMEQYINVHGKIIYKYYFKCKCDCDNYTIVNKHNLTSGNVKSCGCYKTINGLDKRKTNKYELYDNFGIGYCYNDDFKFYFDIEDYDIIKEHYWRHEKSGYIISIRRDYSNKKIRLHRLIMGEPSDTVDHINQDKSDNRKSNLRVCSQQKNNINKSKPKSNKSGFIGVYWSKKDKSWYSQITVDKKCIHLGYTKTKEDALIQRLIAEEKYFGESFAPQRNLFKKYNINILTND